MLKDECWWGGSVVNAHQMPYSQKSVCKVNLTEEWHTQSAPLYLSSKGRYIWSEEPFVIEFNSGKITITSDFEVNFTRQETLLRRHTLLQ